VAYLFYIQDPERPQRLAERFNFLYQVLLDKYRIDEFYDAFIVRPVMWSTNAFWKVDELVVDGVVNGCGIFTRLYSNWSGIVDRRVVDGTVDGIATVIQSSSRAFRLVQTGLVQNYLLVMALGIFVFATIYLLFA
jgi:NADH-quinone oxidoreductase subunit L